MPQSGNAIMLWGGANALETNLVSTDVIVVPFGRAGVPQGAVHSIATDDPGGGGADASTSRS